MRNQRDADSAPVGPGAAGTGDVPEAATYSPKRDGGCAVAFGYDVDMPGAPEEYLYDRATGWTAGCHGHLNEDVADYVGLLASTAERHDARLQFFLQGNTFEDPFELWLDMVKRGHAVDGHTYAHMSLINGPLGEVKGQVAETRRLIEQNLGTASIGMRGPGGYATALDGREDVQQALLDVGIQWVTCKYPYHLLPDGTRPYTDEGTIQDIPDLQPYFYDTGLLEVPFCCYQDRSFFDPDTGGDPSRPLDEWIAYLKQAVDTAYRQNLFLSLTVHPSTSFKHDPNAEYLNEVLSYCRQRPDIRVCTYQDMYQWVIGRQ